MTMTSTPEALQPLSPLYFIESDELLLRNEALDRIRQQARQQGYSERYTSMMNANSNWQDIWAQLQNNSLFNDKKILEIHLPTGKPGRTGAEQLVKLAQHHDTDVIVIIIVPKLDSTTAKSKWVTTLKKASTNVKIAAVSRYQLPQWIGQRLQQHNLYCHADTLAWFAEHVEGNLFAAQQEIDKLALLYPSGTLSLEEVQHAVLDVSRYNVFDMIQAMDKNDLARAYKIVHGLRAENEGSLLAILGILSREIQVLYMVALNPSEATTIMNRMRIFSSRHTTILNKVSLLTFKGIMGLVQHVVDIDKIVRNIPVKGRLHDPWLELERLLAKMITPYSS